LAIPEAGRVIAMSSFCSVFVVDRCGYMVCLFLCVFLFLHGHEGSNGINRGQGRGSGIGFRIGLAPRAEETGPFVQ
jgi:hypothetical protein